MADGTLVKYEIDEAIFEKAPPETFFISYMAERAEGLIKVDAALANLFKSLPSAGPVSTSVIDIPAYRDSVSRTHNAVYK